MSQQTAPFKFLDAYQEKDRDVFFGREQETEDLYDALSGVKHLLVYGPSGAGKTSLVECGLRNQFSDADWYAITIRRRKNINADVFTAINEALEEKIPVNAQDGLPQDVQIDFGEAAEQLFNERYQPIYLLFDQFEELLLLGEQEEKIDFFTRLDKLIRYRVPCRVILIMREEFIGHLSEFEPLCPSIFKHRFWLEKMGRSNVRQTIFQILEAPDYQDKFEVADPESLTDTILSKLPDQKKEIELTHVQVFLTELWDRANAHKEKGELPLLSQELIEEEDNLESVLDAFLKKQMRLLEKSYGKEIPLELLAAMISERHTKLQLTEQELLDDLTGKGIDLQNRLHELLEDLKDRRIIRPLKTGEETRYEISHDLLAYVVGQNLTEEMQLREKANDIYKVYGERQGYFSQEELDHLRPYQAYKPYPPELQERIKASENHIQVDHEQELRKAQEQAEKEQDLRGKAETNAQRARQRTRMASFVALLALAAAVLAGIFFQNSKREQQRAEKQTLRVLANDLSYKAEIILGKGDRNTAFRLAQFAFLYVDSNNYNATEVVHKALYYNDHPERQKNISTQKSWHKNLIGHWSYVLTVAFSPDSQYALTGSVDRTASLWDVNTGKELRTFWGHQGEIRSVMFSPDGKYILTGSTDKTAKLWEVETGKEVRSFNGHQAQIYSIAFSPSGKYVLTGSKDKTAKLWEIDTGSEIQSFEGHNDEIYSVTFSSDGEYVLTGSKDNLAKLWEVSTGNEIRSFDGHNAEINSVAFSPTGKYVLTGSKDTTAKLWEANTGNEIRSFNGHKDRVYGVAFSPDEQYALTGSVDKTAKLWEINTGDEIQSFEGHIAPVQSVAFSPNGQYVLTGSWDDTAIIWEITIHPEAPTLVGHNRLINDAVFSPSGNYILSGGRDHTAKLWEVKTREVIFDFNGHTDYILGVAFSPDEKYILTGSKDKTAKIWEVETGQKIYDLDGHNAEIYSVAISPDNQYALTGSGDKTAKLWELNTGKQIYSFEHIYDVFSVAFSPNGKYILTGDKDKNLKLWDISSRREIRTFEGHLGGIYNVCFSLDGKYILSASADNTAKLWEVATGRELHSFKGHNPSPYRGVIDVSFSHDGKYALTGSLDGTAKLWEVNTGRNIRTIEGHQGFVLAVDFSPDGKQALTAGSDTRIKIWQIDPKVMINKNTEKIAALDAKKIQTYSVASVLDSLPKVWNKFLKSDDWQQLHAFALFYMRQVDGVNNIDIINTNYQKAAECLRRTKELTESAVHLKQYADLYITWSAKLLSDKNQQAANDKVNEALVNYKELIQKTALYNDRIKAKLEKLEKQGLEERVVSYFIDKLN